MPAETTYNFLVWDKPINVPFPVEVEELVSKVDWSNQSWQTHGLPVPDGRYSIVEGKTLYLDELGNGQSKIEKQDKLTGNILAATYLLNENLDGHNYFVTFIVTFVKGEVLEVEFHRMEKILVKDYYEAVKSSREHFAKTIKRNKSFWFKWLYTPWAYTIGFVAGIFLIILGFFQWLTLWAMRKIAPF